jgi:hypothetical protein
MPIDTLFAKGSFDPETATLLASAFDAAWDTVRRSGSPLAANGNASSTRETLAKSIIDSARRGERDPKKLTDDALIHVALPR